MLGVVFCNVDPRATRLRGELESVVGEALPGRRFETVISQAVVIPECSGRGRTLFQTPRYEDHRSVLQYLCLAAEVERRVFHRQEFLLGELPPLDVEHLAMERLHRVKRRQRSREGREVAWGDTVPAPLGTRLVYTVASVSNGKVAADAPVEAVVPGEVTDLKPVAASGQVSLHWRTPQAAEKVEIWRKPDCSPFPANDLRRPSAPARTGRRTGSISG